MNKILKLDKKSIIIYIGIIFGISGLIMPVIRMNNVSHGLYNDKLFLFMSLIFMFIAASSLYIQKRFLNYISGIGQFLISVFYLLSYRSDINKFQNMDSMLGGIFSSMLEEVVKFEISYTPFAFVICAGILYLAAGFISGSTVSETQVIGEKIN